MTDWRPSSIWVGSSSGHGGGIGGYGGGGGGHEGGDMTDWRPSSIWVGSPWGVVAATVAQALHHSHLWLITQSLTLKIPTLACFLYLPKAKAVLSVSRIKMINRMRLTKRWRHPYVVKMSMIPKKYLSVNQVMNRRKLIGYWLIHTFDDYQFQICLFWDGTQIVETTEENQLSPCVRTIQHMDGVFCFTQHSAICINEAFKSCGCFLRGAVQKEFRRNLGFCQQCWRGWLR